MPATRQMSAGVSGSPVTVPGGDVFRGDDGSWFRRILVPVREPGQAYPAMAAAARICGLTGGVLRLVHVRTCDPPLSCSRATGAT